MQFIGLTYQVQICASKLITRYFTDLRLCIVYDDSIVNSNMNRENLEIFDRPSQNSRMHISNRLQNTSMNGIMYSDSPEFRLRTIFWHRDSASGFTYSKRDLTCSEN